MTDRWEKDQVRAALVAGLTSDNAIDRIRILIQELGQYAGALEYRMLEWQNEGTIDEDFAVPSEFPRRFVLAGFKSAMELGVSIDQLMEVAGEAPPAIAPRLRGWLLATAPDLHSERIVGEVELAIAARPPTGDDISALARLSEDDLANHSAVERWKAALPEPPATKVLGESIASGDIDQQVFRAWQWVSVLPPEVGGSEWADARTVLDGRFGKFTVERLQRPRDRIETFTVGSPIGADELLAMSVDDAVEAVVSWRRSPEEHRVGYRELARALSEAVKAAPASWGEEPLKSVVGLHEPIYISHYFQGLKTDAAAIPDDALAGLVSAVELVTTAPWAPRATSDPEWDYDPDWTFAIDEGIQLLGVLASKDRDFLDRREVVYDMVTNAVQHIDPPSGIGGDQDDLTQAINRPCGNALAALLQLVAADLRAERDVPPKAIATLDWVLEQTGDTGRQLRAILGSRVGFLHGALTDWTEGRSDSLFGDAVDASLGRSALEAALQWARPNRWLLQTFHDEILDLVIDGPDRAVDQVMIAMVWGVDGYEPETLVGRFAGRPELVSRSAERLAFVTRSDDVPREMIDRAFIYWDAWLAHEPEAGSLEGFGYFVEVEGAMEVETIERLVRTLRMTGGTIAWTEGIARKVCCPPSGRESLEILDRMLAGATQPWTEQDLAGRAISALNQSDADLATSSEYQRLRNTLLTKGYLPDG